MATSATRDNPETDDLESFRPATALNHISTRTSLKCNSAASFMIAAGAVCVAGFTVVRYHSEPLTMLVTLVTVVYSLCARMPLSVLMLCRFVEVPNPDDHNAQWSDYDISRKRLSLWSLQSGLSCCSCLMLLCLTATVSLQTGMTFWGCTVFVILTVIDIGIAFLGLAARNHVVKEVDRLYFLLFSNPRNRAAAANQLHAGGISAAGILKFIFPRGDGARRAETLDRQISGESGGEWQKDQQTCAVCLEEFEADNEVSYPPCGHLFHTVCLEGWLNLRVGCPLRCDSPPLPEQAQRRLGDAQQTQNPPAPQLQPAVDETPATEISGGFDAISSL